MEASRENRRTTVANGGAHQPLEPDHNAYGKGRAVTEPDNSHIVLFYEGHLLQAVSGSGEAHVAKLARCMIDGAFNALMRIDGTDAAANYSFAVSDRIVGKLKTPTMWPTPKMTEKLPIASPPSPPPTPPRRYSFWTIFAIGWCLGVATAIGFLARV